MIIPEFGNKIDQWTLKPFSLNRHSTRDGFRLLSDDASEWKKLKRLFQSIHFYYCPNWTIVCQPSSMRMSSIYWTLACWKCLRTASLLYAAVAVLIVTVRPYHNRRRVSHPQTIQHFSKSATKSHK